MSVAIRICTDWQPTGAIRLRPGWLFMVAEQEFTRKTGTTTGPGREKWTSNETRWQRITRREGESMLIKGRGEA